jgi:hypothetical protein
VVFARVFGLPIQYPNADRAIGKRLELVLLQFGHFNKLVILESWEMQFTGEENQSLAAGYFGRIFESQAYERGACPTVRLSTETQHYANSISLPCACEPVVFSAPQSRTMQQNIYSVAS